LANKGRPVKSDEVGSIARLSWELLKRDMISRYRGSKLGYIWLVVTPLVMAGVWIFIRSLADLNLSAGRMNYIGYVTAGMFLWQGFTRQVQSSMNRLVQARHLFSKYLFPWEAIVLAGWAETMIEFFVSIVVLVVVLAVTGTLSVGGLFISLPWMLALLLLGGGVGLLLAPFGLLYEDVGRALELVLQTMFFLVPIVYARPTVGAFSTLVDWNPVSALLIAARDELLLGETTVFYNGIVAVLVTVLFVVLGFTILRLARPHLAVAAN
jgi:lipopolysaccharide transport system permease protein